MKYKVLLLLILATLAHSRSLKKSKTRQGDHILNFKKYLDIDLNKFKTFYVFCTEDDFAAYNKLFQKAPRVDSKWTKEDKIDLANLNICIYDLKTQQKKTFQIFELTAMPKYTEEGTWLIETIGRSYSVQSRFNKVFLDVVSEFIGFEYYAAALLHFKFRKKNNNQLSKGLREVYKLFLYIDVIHNYYETILDSVESDKKAFILLEDVIEKSELDLDSARKINVKDIVEYKNLEILKEIFNKNLNIEALLFTIDFKEQQPGGNLKDIWELAAEISSLSQVNPALFEFLKSSQYFNDVNFFFFFKNRSTTMEDLKFLITFTKINNTGKQLSLLKYMKKYQKVKNLLSNEHCNGLTVDEILTALKKTKEESENSTSPEDETNKGILLCIASVPEANLKNAALLKQEIQNLESELTTTQNSNISLILKEIKEQYDKRQYVIKILMVFNDFGPGKMDLEDLRSVFNNQDLSLLRDNHFKITKKLFKHDKFTYRILDSYESLNKINLEDCEAALNKFGIKKLQIKTLLEPFEGNTDALNKFSAFLLGDKLLHSLSESVKNIAERLPLLTLGDVFVLNKIFKMNDFSTFSERLKTYSQEIIKSKGRYGMLDFNSCGKDYWNIVDVDGKLISSIHRITPLLNEFFILDKGEMIKKQVVKIDKKKNFK
jgi:hypothetical protein